MNNSLAEVRPELVSEWSEKNLPLKPDEITFGSNKKVWNKLNLSIEEASIYSNIGTGKLYEMTEKPDCPFVLWVGSRRIIKRKVFEEYIAKQYSI